MDKQTADSDYLRHNNFISKSSGFTLVELMVVVAIIGILIAIAVPRMVGNAERARVATDLFNLHILNSVTRICAINHGDGFYSWFSDKSNEDRWKHLIEEERVLHERIEPTRPGYEFFWSSEKNLWLYSDEEGNAFYFSFNGTGYSSIDEEGLANLFKPRYNNRGWEISAGGVRSTFTGTTGNTENILYIDIGEGIGREYVISVSAAMNDGPGYGILFDTTGEGNNENGYSLQYERSNGGRIIIRPRINGRENPNIADLGGSENWESHHIYQHLTEQERSTLEEGNRVSPILFNYSLNNAQKELLESGNDLKLKVRDAANGKRKIDVYLGNDQVIESFEYNIADPNNPMTTSGYRVWFNNGHSGENVLFKSFDIGNVSE
jgi:prepilin-type N-terminal cleavage/methylation domain-containing protein